MPNNENRANDCGQDRAGSSANAVAPKRVDDPESSGDFVPMQLEGENAEISAAIPGLGEQLAVLDDMDIASVEELLDDIDTYEELIERKDEARTRAKLLARLQLADGSARCVHIKGNNERCGSPAMNDDEFCYFHSEARKLRDADQALAKAAQLPVLEDMHGLQLAIMRVCGLLAANKIEEKTARAIFDGLRLAQKTLDEHTLKLA
jgi:hypothetical protein